MIPGPMNSLKAFCSKSQSGGRGDGEILGLKKRKKIPQLRVKS